MPPDAGVALREAVRTQEHERADGRRREGGARARRVAPHEVELQLAELRVRNDDVGELAEARRHAVDDPVLGDGAVDDGARGVHARRGARRQRGRGFAAGDEREFFE